MKVFTEEEGSFSGKVNFIDENNVCVGYDLESCCCEHADWFIASSVKPYEYDMKLYQPEALPKYSFDPDFFEEPGSESLDEGSMAVFRLVAAGLPPLYLHLFNCHNGYYSHGFEVKHGKNVVQCGTL